MLSSNGQGMVNVQPTFRASLQFTQSEITAFLVSALNRRGYTNVQVAYKYNDNGSRYDRFAVPTLDTILTASKDGKPETETIKSDQVKETIFAELVADGHTLDKDSVGFNYTDMNRQVYGSATLLIPRKRS